MYSSSVIFLPSTTPMSPQLFDLYALQRQPREQNQRVQHNGGERERVSHGVRITPQGARAIAGRARNVTPRHASP